MALTKVAAQLLSVFGYGAGQGGTVTQLTSKGIPVTINKPAGKIIMSNGAIAAGVSVPFAVNNSFVSAADIPTVCLGNVGNGISYDAWVSYTADGVFYVTLKNNTAGSLSEAVVINFAIIKGATS